MWKFHDKGDRDDLLEMMEKLCNDGKNVEEIDLMDKINEKGISTDTMM